MDLTVAYNTPLELFNFENDVLKIVDLVDKLSDQWHPTIDFWVILGMKWKLDTNSFSTTNDALGGRKIYGMARFYSFLNHSCDPNADWRVKEIPLRGQRQRFEIEVTVGLNQTITPSDRILISYLPPADLQLSVAERRRKLESWFGTGVQCQCRKCIAGSAALLAAANPPPPGPRPPGESSSESESSSGNSSGGSRPKTPPAQGKKRRRFSPPTRSPYGPRARKKQTEEKKEKPAWK